MISQGRSGSHTFRISDEVRTIVGGSYDRGVIVGASEGANRWSGMVR
jgi:hypothetical protein